MSSFVYVLMHCSGERFKVGKAVDIRARAEQLYAKRFKKDGSFGLLFGSEKQSEAVERVLHRMFVQWRCDRADVIAADGIEDGASEFFAVDCYERLVSFTRANLDLLRAEFISDIGNVLDPAGQSEVYVDVDGLRQRNEDRQAKKLAQELKRRKEAAEEEQRALDLMRKEIGPAFEALSKACSVSWRYDEILLSCRSSEFVGTVKEVVVDLCKFKSHFYLPANRCGAAPVTGFDAWDSGKNGYCVVLRVIQRSDGENHLLSRLGNRFWDVVEKAVAPLTNSESAIHTEIWAAWVVMREKEGWPHPFGTKPPPEFIVDRNGRDMWRMMVKAVTRSIKPIRDGWVIGELGGNNEHTRRAAEIV